MALTEAVINRQNPWWSSRNWQELDPHLRRLRHMAVRLPAPLISEIDLESPGIHTLRGPRQTGKSTDLKLLAERALKLRAGPAGVIYISADLLQDQSLLEVSATVVQAKEMAGSGPGSLILLDEVTSVDNWQIAVKSLWDDGVIDRDVVICTGSSAIDLHIATTERLPGRRGAGRDHLVLPQSFAQFARALYPEIPQGPSLLINDLCSEEGVMHLKPARPYGQHLEKALDRYLLFGGLPAAVVEATTGARAPSQEVKGMLWDSIVKETLRKGASEPALQALLERLCRSLGSKVSWSRLAREMDVPLRKKRVSKSMAADYKVVRDYMEFLATGYFTLIVYYWRRDSESISLSNDKKLYFGDPLLHTIALDIAPGLAFNKPAAIENAIALCLYRSYEPVAGQYRGYLAPSKLHVWQTGRSEVDFVCGSREEIEIAEVKYQRSVDRRSIAGIHRAMPGRPLLIVTSNELTSNNDQAMIPAHLALWALASD